MKKLLAIFLLTVGFVIGVSILIVQSGSKPPLPFITVDGKKITVMQGSYCWRSFFQGECADMISPPEIIDRQGVNPVRVSPESRLKISFKKMPLKNTLTANIWRNRNTESILLKNNSLTIPKEKGVYIYDLSARWEKGDSSYVFAIEVK